MGHGGVDEQVEIQMNGQKPRNRTDGGQIRIAGEHDPGQGQQGREEKGSSEGGDEQENRAGNVGNGQEGKCPDQDVAENDVTQGQFFRNSNGRECQLGQDDDDQQAGHGMVQVHMAEKG